jgi:hypothetical protein
MRQHQLLHPQVLPQLLLHLHNLLQPSLHQLQPQHHHHQQQQQHLQLL